MVDDGFSHTEDYGFVWPRNGGVKPTLGIERVGVYMWDSDDVPTWVTKEDSR